jgi:hypothetical protein
MDGRAITGMKRMDRALGPVSAVVLALALCSSTAVGQDNAVAEDVQGQLNQLQQQLGQIVQENDAMQRELDELRALNNDEWLTERRADEIRALVQDVLADADVRSSLLDSGITAGWDEHFYLASSDGRFLLRIGGGLQVRFIFNYHNESVLDETPFTDGDRYRYGFENRRSKLTFRGHMFTPDVQYLIRTDFTRDEPALVNGLAFLQDAWVRWRMSNEWNVRFGKMKLPFNREELVSWKYQLAIERSIVNQSLNIGRSQGVELEYSNDTNRWSAMFSNGGVDSIGGLNGVTGFPPGGVNPPALAVDSEWSITSRYELKFAGTWQQLKQFTSPPGQEFALLWGIAGHAQQGETVNAESNEQDATWLAWTTDLSVQWGGANAFASFTHHYIESSVLANRTFANVFGIVVQGGFYVTPKLELYGRWQYGFFDNAGDLSQNEGIDFIDMSTVELGVNYYLQGQEIKWSTDLGFGLTRIGNTWGGFNVTGWRTDAEGAEPQIVFRTQLQLLF